MSILRLTSEGGSPTANEHRPNPSSPTWAWPSSDVVAPHSGGCGFCQGLGCTRRRGICQNSPSNEYSSLVQQPTTCPMASCHMRRLSPGSMPNPSSSARVAERPVPRSTRPPESRSRTATDSAVRTGWLYGFGISRTPYPSRMRSVRAAMAPYRTSGFEQCEYSCRKWCSTVQNACQPWRSPAMACSSVFW